MKFDKPFSKNTEESFESTNFRDSLEGILKEFGFISPRIRNVLKVMQDIFSDGKMSLTDKENFKDKQILDLGCGSILTDEGGGHDYSPILCRILEKMSAHPIGIDVNRQSDNEKFESHIADLTDPTSLDFIPNDSCDVVVDSALSEYPLSPTLEKILEKKNITEAVFKEQHLLRIARVLKTGGMFIRIMTTDPNIWIKTDKGLEYSNELSIKYMPRLF